MDMINFTLVSMIKKEINQLIQVNWNKNYNSNFVKFKKFIKFLVVYRDHN